MDNTIEFNMKDAKEKEAKVLKDTRTVFQTQFADRARQLKAAKELRVQALYDEFIDTLNSGKTSHAMYIGDKMQYRSMLLDKLKESGIPTREFTSSGLKTIVACITGF